MCFGATSSGLSRSHCFGKSGGYGFGESSGNARVDDSFILERVEGFLGLTGYYRRFIQHYAQLAAPLTNQLRKDNFRWNEVATVAFQKQKEVMLSALVLAIPNFLIPFIVETDASGKGLGAV